MRSRNQSAVLAEVLEFSDASRALLFAIAGRPDITRLFGPFERAAYEELRVLVNRRALPPLPLQSTTLERTS